MNLEKEVEAYADRVIGFKNELHSEWEDAQRHIINFCKESKWIQIGKIRSQIEVLIEIRGDYNSDNRFYLDDKIEQLEQQLKELENGN